MKTQGTVVKMGRFQIDRLEERIAPSSATLEWTATSTAKGGVGTTSVKGNSSTNVDTQFASSSVSSTQSAMNSPAAV